MNHSFAQVPQANIKRSSFNRSHSYKTTFDSGYLVPFYVDEVLPGDTFNLDVSIFARLATPIVPIMDDIYLDTFFFFVPNRLVWDNFVKQMGEQVDPGDTIDYLTPTVNFTSAPGLQSLADYFGVPPTVANPGQVNALPFRAYNLIYNRWFRDENLQESVSVPTGDGPDDPSIYNVLRRGKRHDYFTSALPWPQKGPGVDLPLGGTAPVIGNGMAVGFTDGTNNAGLYALSDNSLVGKRDSYGANVGVTTSASGSFATGSIGLTTDPDKSGIVADLSEATAVTINSLRQAFMLQQLLEKDARGGTRYKELLLSHYGVSVPDYRLQWPEYLGGSSGMMNIHQVAQTSASDSVTPQGNLAAYGVFSDNNHGFTKSFVEHGFVIGLVSVRANLSYQQGLERFWRRKTRYDYYWPSLAHLGEQAIDNAEIFLQDNSVLDSNGSPVNDGVFGYQERSAEYRYKPSHVTGKLRSGTDNSLDVWHLSQYFENLPVLNSEFIEDNPPIARALAVQNEPQIIFDSYLKLNCVRPMPVHGIPGFQSHF